MSRFFLLGLVMAIFGLLNLHVNVAVAHHFDGVPGVKFFKEFRQKFGTITSGPTVNVPLNTDVHWLVDIQVSNNGPDAITDVSVRDTFSAAVELGAHDPAPGNPGEGFPSYAGAVVAMACERITELGQPIPTPDAPTFGPVGGNVEGATRIDWFIGTMAADTRCVLILDVSTDINPAGRQGFTSPGTYCINSGARLRFFNAAGMEETRSTGQLCVTTVP